jgi:hypothetical protein
MAKMNLEEILMAVQAAVDGSVDSIDWSDDDTLTRKNIVNKGIRRWAHDNATRWQELAENVTLGSVRAGQTTFSLPGDYFMLDGVFWPNGDKLPIRNIRQATDEGRYGFVSGNVRDGFTLNLGWTPSLGPEVGQNLRLLYYREPRILNKPGDVPEMSDPNFLVAYTASEVNIGDDTTMYAKFNGDALNYLANMRDINSQIAQGQEFYIEDESGGLGY